MKQKFIPVVLSFLTAGNILAVKAKPGIINFLQPDGTTVSINLCGDEWFNFATDLSGNLLLPNDEGVYEYAVWNEDNIAVVSGLKATSLNKDFTASLISGIEYAGASKMKSSRIRQKINSSESYPKYRYSSSVFPTTGSPRSLVVLVDYQDYRFSMEDPLEYYLDFLNGDNFDRNGATGSCRQFYADNSNGAFIPTFDVYGPILLENKRSFYGSGMEQNASMMVVEAVKALDDNVDFSVYDNNNDGYVDNIYIIYADRGEADGGPKESVWPFSWELEEEGIYLAADGVKFNTYGCSNELRSSGVPDGIGTFVHEFGHVLGLPDLYNTQSTWDSTTPCAWSTMDSGNYNNDNRTPANFSAFERYSLGWLTPEEILYSGEFSLSHIADSNKAFIMTTEEEPDEFFLVETRQKKGWDAYLPAEGLLIWRCEFLQKVWDTNSVNNVMSHQYVELIRADNEKHSSQASYTGDPFPGSNNVTEFGIETIPALVSWHKDRTFNVYKLSEIREEDDKMVFTARVKEERRPTGVEVITEDNEIEINGNIITVSEGYVHVYDISGRFVGVVTADRPLMLEKGVYVVKGRKIVL